MHQHALPGTVEGVVHRTWGYGGLFWREEDATSAAHLLTSPGEQLSTKSICCPGRGAVGATGGNSHLAGFKTKVKSQLLYYQSRNGYNIKFFNLKKKEKRYQNHIHPFSYPEFHLVENLIQKGVVLFGKSG